MLQITPQIVIPDSELSFTFARSGGPGGQNVNKVSSKVILRWNPSTSASLPDAVRARLLEQQRSRLTTEGELVISSQQARDQGRNIEDAREKLRAIILRATHVPRVRRPTKPTRNSQRQRVETKRRRAQTKQRRRQGNWSDD